jgi:hypothetical protein
MITVFQTRLGQEIYQNVMIDSVVTCLPCNLRVQHLTLPLGIAFLGSLSGLPDEITSEYSSSSKDPASGPETRRGISSSWPKCQGRSHALLEDLCVSDNYFFVHIAFARERSASLLYILASLLAHELLGSAEATRTLPSYRLSKPCHTAERCETTYT